MSTPENCRNCCGDPLTCTYVGPCSKRLDVSPNPIMYIGRDECVTLNADIVVTANSLHIPLDQLKVKCPKCGCEFHHY